jgi:hypothetical protein
MILLEVLPMAAFFRTNPASPFSMSTSIGILPLEISAPPPTDLEDCYSDSLGFGYFAVSDQGVSHGLPDQITDLGNVVDLFHLFYCRDNISPSLLIKILLRQRIKLFHDIVHRNWILGITQRIIHV